MQQLGFKFFFPLTEQAPLDLDYSESISYEARKAASNISSTMYCTDGVILTGSSITTSLNIDLDNYPITIRSSKKPNIFALLVYKALGIVWRKK